MLSARDGQHRRHHRRRYDLIRPLIRANASRRYNAHVIIFFIILVANVGGALSPLGDPPLFVGFLSSVDFFWTTRLWIQTAIVSGLLLSMFVAFDFWRYGTSRLRVRPKRGVRSKFAASSMFR